MSTTPNLASIKPSLDNLQAIERELTASLIERDEVIRASLVALLARQHLVVLGPPGTAKVAIPNAAIDLVEQLRRDIAAKGIIISDRRWGQSLSVLQAHALTEGRDAVTEDDLIFLKHVLWQSPEQRAEIGKALARIGNPLNSKAVDYEDQAASAHRECMDAQQAAQSEEQKMQAAIEANTKLKQIGVKLQELRDQAAEQGRNTNRIDKVIEAVAKMKQEIASLVL